MDLCQFSGIHNVEYGKVIATLEHVQSRIAEGSASSTSLDSCAAVVTLMFSVNCARIELGPR